MSDLRDAPMSDEEDTSPTDVTRAFETLRAFTWSQAQAAVAYLNAQHDPAVAERLAEAGLTRPGAQAVCTVLRHHYLTINPTPGGPTWTLKSPGEGDPDLIVFVRQADGWVVVYAKTLDEAVEEFG